MNFKLVIFDLDGTLVNSIGGIAYSMNNVLNRYGFPCHDIKSYKQFVGNGIKVLVKRALPEGYKDEKNILKFYELMKIEYTENWNYEMTVYDGIETLLEFLNKKNILISVNTNKNEQIAKVIVNHYFSKSNFKMVIGDNTWMPKKPDPTGAKAIAEKLGVRIKECLYLGDSEIDIETAKNAGMFSVSVLWGFREKNCLLSYKPDLFVRNPGEVINLLK